MDYWMIPSKFPGKCRECHERITVGQRVAYSRAESGVLCLDCAEDLEIVPKVGQSMAGKDAAKERVHLILQAEGPYMFGTLSRLAELESAKLMSILAKLKNEGRAHLEDSLWYGL